ncbi:MAG: UDP-N-acetylmuramoyl-L-alanine--D-glutamate ligase [Minisyncoccia bacterium]
MAPYDSFFAGKRVTILGLGLLGRAVGDAEFLAQRGAHVTVTDVKSAEELAASVERLSKYPNITFHLGGHVESDFTNTDMVIKAAGVRLDSPEVATAREAGVPVYMSTALAARFAGEVGVTVVGVTGTRGKSTVAHMIHHALVAAAPRHSSTKLGTRGSGQGKRAHLGGNVRGVSTLALLPDMQKGDFLVLELDSWQLQGFGTLKISPQVAIFTNLMPDHQNYYADMDSYFADKANIFKFQKKGDSLIATPELAERIQGIGAGEEAYRVHIESPTPSEWKLEMPGEHNRVNAALAAAALEVLSLTPEEIRAGLESFGGVEGRLQFVREVNLPAQAGGVKIYNDNNATTPEATIAALQALDSGRKNILLIIGGADKGLDMSTMLLQMAVSCKRVLCLSGSGTERITPFMSDFSLYDDLGEACREALRGAEAGDVILFSPAFASFGLFKNEYDRNDRFLKVIESL